MAVLTDNEISSAYKDFGNFFRKATFFSYFYPIPDNDLQRPKVVIKAVNGNFVKRNWSVVTFKTVWKRRKEISLTVIIVILLAQ